LHNNLETVLDYFDKRNDHVIAIGDLNMNLKNDCNKKNLLNLLNMFVLQAVINVPTGTVRGATSAVDRWGLETDVLIQLYQIIVYRYLR
jgi:hypothetical protein